MCYRNLKLVWSLKMHLLDSNFKFTSLSRKKTCSLSTVWSNVDPGTIISSKYTRHSSNSNPRRTSSLNLKKLRVGWWDQKASHWICTSQTCSICLFYIFRSHAGLPESGIYVEVAKSFHSTEGVQTLINAGKGVRISHSDFIIDL